MVNNRAEQTAGDSLWICGLSMADFEVPSKPTAVAQAAHALTAVTLDLADARTSGGEDALVGNDEDLPIEVMDLTAMEGWAEAAPDDGDDYADRKVVWPALNPTSFQPASSVQHRIEDNIAALELAKQLGEQQRTPTPDEMTQLLRYSGWGGAARVFAPDGSTPQPLAPWREKLKAASTDVEYAGMQSSVNTSFFTPPELVKALWQIVERLGFKGGRVIEPSAGVGHVIAGMPSNLARKSMLTAVEKDRASAAILERAFAPYGLQVHACGLEEAKLPVGFFDLVVGNAPFGNFRTNDTSNAPYADWLIHNWFLGKSVELVRPGGLVVMITSRGSLDSKTDAHRRWLGAHADLVAAFRLPTMAFQAHSNTEAVTDIVVFKRREMPDFGAKPYWTGAEAANQLLFAAGQRSSITAYRSGHAYTAQEHVNAHFNRNPDAVLGQLKWESTQHGQSALPVFAGDMAALSARLDELIAELPEGLYEPAKAELTVQAQSPMARYANLERAMPGAFVCHDGRICISEGPELVDVDGLYTGTARKRLLGMLEIREAVNAVIEHQVKSEDEAELKRLQQHLNRTYDAFAGQMGALSTAANSRIMRSDPNWPLLLALELWDEEAETVTKADIFFKRTVGVPEVPQKVDNVKDALLISLALFGKIDLKDMAKRCGKPVRDVIENLRAESLAYRDPVQAIWVPADEYLSGHIRDKIAQARAAGSAYECNIPALEAVLPQDLGPAEVEARLGAPWIPCDVVKQFATELVKDQRNQIEVSFDQATATWSVKTPGSHHPEWVGDRSLQVVRWGTDNRCALTLVEAALNQQPPTITRKVGEATVVDAAATFAAREKWQAIRDEFRMWVYKDDARRDRLLRIYNDKFNQLVPRVFDGRHLHLPGMSTAVTPYEHQLSAIWRILVAGNTLLAHCVGAGKTLTMVAASMELRRLGKARKPFHVVQNSCLSQYCAEFLRLYPQARVLMATKEDLSGDKRRAFVARIATGDWDAVVMTQSTFERLMLSPEIQYAFIERQLAESRTMMALTEDRGAKRSIKEIERRMKEYEAKIKRLVEGGKADEETAVWFDELGFDWGFIDEAHSLKNLGRMSKMPRIAGLPNVSSQRAFDAFMKTRLIMEARGNKEEGVVLASATPISNSLAEMHVVQMFLQPETLKRYGLYEFDAWSASFGEAVTGIELAPDGSGFRTNTRFCKFVNVSELMAIFKGVADIRTKRMLNLPTPRIGGGKPQVLVAKASDTLKAIVAELVKRADAIRNRTVKPEEDNMLAITNDGRRAALDVRMMDPSLPADPEGKLAKAAANIFRIWKAGMAEKHTQLVFSDLGTPGARGFSVYEEIRRMLIELGIPENEIAFVQDYDSDTAKAKLFKKVRDGAIRVLLGSTPKMGTGTNVQKRLKSVHSLDVPWRPADLEQRDGRADRQGNECDSIELWRYVTEGSFDAYSYNLLDVKARFIEQVMTAEKGLRTIEDISITALSYAELKAVASGNPLVLEKATVDAKVQKLSLAYDQWEQDRWRFGHRKAAMQNRLSWINQHMPAVEQDAQLAEAVARATPPVKALGTVASNAMAGASNTAEAIGAAFRACSGAKLEGPFAEVNGFKLSVVRGYMAVELEVTTPHSGLSANVERPNMNDVVGVGNAAINTIAAIARDPAKLREEYGRKTEELASVEQMLTEDFEHREPLAQARARQAEIEAQLDLDKAAAGTQAMEAEDA
jgi:N12 class adenine-specific DNA methylase